MPVILGRAIRSSLGSRLGVSLSWLQLYAPDCASLYGTKVLGVPQLTSITRRLTGPYPPLAVAEEHNGTMTYLPAATRYDAMQYRRSGRSGLQLPAISVGLWQNFGHDRPIDSQRAVIHRAFDLGITHFDLANNYGPPYGSAELNFGRILREDLAAHRDELLISSKAGWDMWPGPYGQGGGSRKYVLASLDQSLRRVGVDYFDIFYSHRFDLDTPLEETMGALATAVRQGKTLYVGISSYSAAKTREAAAILRSEGVPMLIHQPSYNLLNRWIEPELLDALEEVGAGMIAFTALAPVSYTHLTLPTIYSV